MSALSVEKYKKAYCSLMEKKAKTGFKAHAIAYGVVNAGLIALNLVISPQLIWFFFPLVGWGIGLGCHYYFGVRRYPEHLEEEEREAERMAQEQK